MTDPFNGSPMEMNRPASGAFAITPSDSVDLPLLPRAIYIGGGGAIACILGGDSAAVTFTGLAAGTILPARAKRVLATGTTATLLLGLY